MNVGGVMHKLFVVTGILFTMSAVVLGAFAAHGLKSKLTVDMLNVFQTGVQYQMYHGLGLMLIAVIASHVSSGWLTYSGYLMLVGVICFSGSLYALALTGNKWFGPITPLGGSMLILGWLALLLAVLNSDL